MTYLNYFVLDSCTKQIHSMYVFVYYLQDENFTSYGIWIEFEYAEWWLCECERSAKAEYEDIC